MADVNFTVDELNGSANFQADLSDEQVESMEAAASAKCRGIQRRLCLVACARSFDELRTVSVESTQAFLEMFESIEAFRTHCQGLTEIAEAAYVRMLLAYEDGPPENAAA